MHDDLSAKAWNEIDALPFGYIALAADGTVRRYNRFEAALSRRDPNEVLGRNFFREVAPCTQVADFEGRFRAFAAGEVDSTHLEFGFTFRFKHATERVRIGLVRSPLAGEVIVTVHRVVATAAALGPELHPDVVTGALRDASGEPATVGNVDFWRSLVGLWRHLPAAEGRAELTRLGASWARAHLIRVDRLIQRDHGVALREAELQLALEAISGSLGPLGLGRFEADFAQRERGLVVVRHLGSPFARLFGADGTPSCALLGGFLAAAFGTLANQPLAALELGCSRGNHEPCTFLVATERRLERFVEAAPETADGLLRSSLSAHVAAPTDTAPTDTAPMGTMTAMAGTAL